MEKKSSTMWKNSLYYCRQFSELLALFLLCISIHFLSHKIYAISRKKVGNMNYFFQNFDNYPEKFYFYFSSHFYHPEHLFWIAPESSDFCLVALLVKILTFRTWKQQMLKDIWYLPQTGTVPPGAMKPLPGILPVKGKQMKENWQFLTNPTWFKQLLFKVITVFQGFMRGLLAESTSPHLRADGQV